MVHLKLDKNKTLTVSKTCAHILPLSCYPRSNFQIPAFSISLKVKRQCSLSKAVLNWAQVHRLVFLFVILHLQAFPKSKNLAILTLFSSWHSMLSSKILSKFSIHGKATTRFLESLKLTTPNLLAYSIESLEVPPLPKV